MGNFVNINFRYYRNWCRPPWNLCNNVDLSATFNVIFLQVSLGMQASEISLPSPFSRFHAIFAFSSPPI